MPSWPISDWQSCWTSAPAATDVTGQGFGRTRTGTVLGTIAYMSPEQAAGRPLDPRSDIFSFGVVLYEFVSGRKPFKGKSDLDSLQALIYEPAEPLPADVPQSLRSIVEKALEKDPADRYQSMRDLVVDLRRHLRPSTAIPAMSTTARGATAAVETCRKQPSGLVSLCSLLSPASRSISWRGPAGRPSPLRFCLLPTSVAMQRSTTSPMASPKASSTESRNCHPSRSSHETRSFITRGNRLICSECGRT